MRTVTTHDRGELMLGTPLAHEPERLTQEASPWHLAAERPGERDRLNLKLVLSARATPFSSRDDWDSLLNGTHHGTINAVYHILRSLLASCMTDYDDQVSAYGPYCATPFGGAL